MLVSDVASLSPRNIVFSNANVAVSQSPRQAIARSERKAGRLRTWSRQLRLGWLLCRVHTDAFRYAPLAYLQGIGWRLRYLRVRSRNRLAALMGRSPHAYSLWIARK